MATKGLCFVGDRFFLQSICEERTKIECSEKIPIYKLALNGRMYRTPWSILIWTSQISCNANDPCLTYVKSSKTTEKTDSYGEESKGEPVFLATLPTQGCATIVNIKAWISSVCNNNFWVIRREGVIFPRIAGGAGSGGKGHGESGVQGQLVRTKLFI